MTKESQSKVTELAISRMDEFLSNHGRSWPKEKRAEFRRFLYAKLTPVRNSGAYGVVCVAVQLSKMKLGEYENMLTKGQLEWLDNYLSYCPLYEPSLRQAGYFELAEEAGQILKDPTGSKDKK